MARGINKVILIGNLGQDPEVRFTPNGTAVANLNLATTDTWLDKQSGQKQERTEWHRLVMFNKTAEIAQQYLKKGAKIYVEGRLQTRKWQDQNGQDRYSTEIVVNDMQMLDGRNGDFQGNQQGPQSGYPNQQQGGQPSQNHPQNQGYPNNPPANNQQQGNAYRDARQGNGNFQGAPGGNAASPASGQQQGSYGAPEPGSFDDYDQEIPF